jgi:hypothetical protein
MEEDIQDQNRTITLSQMFSTLLSVQAMAITNLEMNARILAKLEGSDIAAEEAKAFDRVKEVTTNLFKSLPEA